MLLLIAIPSKGIAIIAPTEIEASREYFKNLDFLVNVVLLTYSYKYLI